jgi:hypothetical protein
VARLSFVDAPPKNHCGKALKTELPERLRALPLPRAPGAVQASTDCADAKA